MKHNTILFAVFAVCLILLASCQTATEQPDPLNQPQAPTLIYDFTEGVEAWKGDFVDLPADYNPDAYELGFHHGDIPIIGAESKGLVLEGQNLDDQLFLYTYRNISTTEGLEPNTTYNVELSFDLATNFPAIPNSLGESVYLKAGIVTVRPLPQEETEGENSYIRLNLDKGKEEDDGSDLLTLGNAVKIQGETDAYQLKNFTHSFTVTTGVAADTWVIIGIDTYIPEKVKLYLDNIQVSFFAQ